MGHLLLAGAGHAHLETLRRLGEITARGHRVTVVGPDPRHYYSGMGPGLLGGLYQPHQISLPVERMTLAGGGEFARDVVTGIDPARRVVFLGRGGELAYDVLSCNTGSRVPDNLVANPRDVYPVKPIQNLRRARERLLELSHRGAVEVAVVGGGPAGLEVAGNVWAALGTAAPRPRVTLYAGAGLLSGQIPSVVRRARGLLIRRGIRLVEGARVTRIDQGRVELADGGQGFHQMVLLATGVKPSPLFESSGLATGPDGGLLVTRHLNHPNHPEIFGGGDCVHFAPEPLAKVGVHAVRQGPVLAHNLWASLEDRPLRPFIPGGRYLLIFNLGGRRGLLVKWSLVWEGRLAFALKDFIDRRFIARFRKGYE